MAACKDRTVMIGEIVMIGKTVMIEIGTIDQDRIVMIGEIVMIGDIVAIETMTEDIVVIEIVTEVTAEKGIMTEIGVMIETEGMIATDPVATIETILGQESIDETIGEIDTIDQTMVEGITSKTIGLEAETKEGVTETILEVLVTLTEVKAETLDNPGTIPETGIGHLVMIDMTQTQQNVSLAPNLGNRAIDKLTQQDKNL